MNSVYWKLGVIAVIGLVAVLGFYRLTQSPPTWYDEGMILQLAENVAVNGVMGLQLAPGQFVSAWHVSTGFPVVIPVALSFKIFGVGLAQARVVAVIAILLLVAAAFLLLRRQHGPWYALWGMAFLATFSSLYGDGKNVLGEVPGMMFLCIFLYFMNELEADRFRSWKHALLTGIFFGLTCATKPIFFLVGAALLLTLLAKRKHIEWNRRWVGAFLGGGLISGVIYLYTQFGSADTVASVFHFFTNPYGAGHLQSMIIPNLKRFFTEATPIYTLITFLVWAGALVTRKIRKVPISFAETCAFIFASLILLAYLRLPGWYRYFFPANVLILMFMPYAVKTLTRRAPHIILGIFLLTQAFYLVHGSWISNAPGDDTAVQVAAYAHSTASSTAFFVYDAPEVVPLIVTQDYYQYFSAGGVWVAGQEHLDLLREGRPDIVITDYQKLADAAPLLSAYSEEKRIGRYVILKKI